MIGSFDERSYVQLAVEQSANVHQLRDSRAAGVRRFNPAHWAMPQI